MNKNLSLRRNLLPLLLSLLLLPGMAGCSADDDSSADQGADDDQTIADDDDVIPDDDDASPDGDNDDDSGDDNIVDDDVADDDVADDDVADDDVADDDVVDDDIIDDDTADDDDNDNDDVPQIILQEYIGGGAGDTEGIALDSTGKAYIPVNAALLSWLYTIDGESVSREQIGDHGSIVDVQVGPDNEPQALFYSRIDQQYYLLQRNGLTWHSQAAPIDSDYSWWPLELYVDHNGHAHLCLTESGLEIIHYSNTGDEWTTEIIYQFASPITPFAEACRMVTSEDDSLYLFFYEPWYDGEVHQRLWWATNETGAWEFSSINEDARDINLISGGTNKVHAVYDGVGVGRQYGIFNQSQWTWETIPFTGGEISSLWLLDGSPVMLLRYGNSIWSDLHSLKKENGGWSETDIFDNVVDFSEAILDSQGLWHLPYSNGIDSTLYYLTVRAGEWNTVPLRTAESMHGPLTQGWDSEARLRLAFDYSNLGWHFLINEENQWLLERFSMVDLFGAQFLTLTPGDTHMVSLDTYLGSTVYAHESAAGWETESFGYLAYPMGFDVSTDGRPAMATVTSDHLWVSERDVGDWQVRLVPEPSIVHYYRSPLVTDDEHNLTVCYMLEESSEIRCARRIDGTWTIDTVDAGGAEGAYCTNALALDGNNTPHFVYARVESYSQIETRLAVFDGNTWTSEKLFDGEIEDGRLLIDETGVHHLFFVEDRDDSDQLGYVTDACGYWQVVYLDYGSIQEITSPLWIENGYFHLAYLADYGLWRLVLDPPHC